SKKSSAVATTISCLSLLSVRSVCRQHSVRLPLLYCGEPFLSSVAAFYSHFSLCSNDKRPPSETLCRYFDGRRFHHFCFDAIWGGCGPGHVLRRHYRCGYRGSISQVW